MAIQGWEAFNGEKAVISRIGLTRNPGSATRLRIFYSAGEVLGASSLETAYAPFDPSGDQQS